MRMRTRFMIASLTLGLAAVFVVVLTFTTLPERPGAAVALQSGPSLVADECLEMEPGEVSEFSIRISNVTDLTAWEIYFAYDRALLEVVGRDVRLFLSRDPNSSVFDLSDPVPNSTGLYRLAAADVSLDAVPDSGSGIIATIIVHARAEGVSPAAIYRSTSLPLGPRLIGEGAEPIGDISGDGIFDGSITNGQIAISRACDRVAPTANPEVEDDFTAPPGQSVTITGGPTPTPSGDTPAPGASGTDSDPPTTPSFDGNQRDDDDGDPKSTGEPTELGDGGTDGGGRGPGIGSSDDNTFWGIVLIGGGMALGLAVTYMFARVTRKPA
jgi:hypothetical protein